MQIKQTNGGNLLTYVHDFEYIGKIYPDCPKIYRVLTIKHNENKCSLVVNYVDRISNQSVKTTDTFLGVIETKHVNHYCIIIKYSQLANVESIVSKIRYIFKPSVLGVINIAQEQLEEFEDYYDTEVLSNFFVQNEWAYITDMIDPVEDAEHWLLPLDDESEDLGFLAIFSAQETCQFTVLMHIEEDERWHQVDGAEETYIYNTYHFMLYDQNTKKMVKLNQSFALLEDPTFEKLNERLFLIEYLIINQFL